MDDIKGRMLARGFIHKDDIAKISNMTMIHMMDSIENGMSHQYPRIPNPDVQKGWKFALNLFEKELPGYVELFTHIALGEYMQGKEPKDVRNVLSESWCRGDKQIEFQKFVERDGLMIYMYDLEFDDPDHPFNLVLAKGYKLEDWFSEDELYTYKQRKGI